MHSDNKHFELPVIEWINRDFKAGVLNTSAGFPGLCSIYRCLRVISLQVSLYIITRITK